MPDWGSVTITGIDGSDIYINGDYSLPAGKAPGPFVVPFVYSIFDRLDANGAIDARGYAQPIPDDPDVTLVLTPIVPPVQL
ncbi:MAG: hypothetical protein WDM89_13550 [Rhizomicrobium sp.]